MTGQAVLAELLRLAAETPDGAPIARAVAALRQAHPELRGPAPEAVDAALRAGALARLDTADLLAELERRGLTAS